MSKTSKVSPQEDDAAATEVAPAPAEAPKTAAAVKAAVKKATTKAATAKKVATKAGAKKPPVLEQATAATEAEQPATEVEPPATAASEAPVDAKPKTPTSAETTKPPKAKKPKLVRDSFTLPEADYALFAALKVRALGAGVEVKKSELLRAALVTLAKLEDAALLEAIAQVERIKPGRPKR